MDRQLLIIIIFLGITFSLAGLLAMGAVPKIFETKETAEQTKSETVNQTEIILKQFHRENNTTHKILSNQGVVVDKLNQSLENQRIMLTQINKTIVHNQEDLALNLNISKQHQQVARDHDTIQDNMLIVTKNVGNVTDQIYELLKVADERNYQATINNKKILNNLTEELKEIKTLHKEIKKEIEAINSNPKS